MKTCDAAHRECSMSQKIPFPGMRERCFLLTIALYRTPCFHVPCGPENISWGHSRPCRRDEARHVFLSCVLLFGADDDLYFQLFHRSVKEFLLKDFAHFLPISIYRRAWAASAPSKNLHFRRVYFVWGVFPTSCPLV
jgi:hypothetical protein